MITQREIVQIWLRCSDEDRDRPDWEDILKIGEPIVVQAILSSPEIEELTGYNPGELTMERMIFDGVAGECAIFWSDDQKAKVLALCTFSDE